jgi:hypothetical protein
VEFLVVLLGLAIILAVAYALYRVAGQIWSAPDGLFRRVVVFEWERGLVYRNGRFERQLLARLILAGAESNPDQRASAGPNG